MLIIFIDYFLIKCIPIQNTHIDVSISVKQSSRKCLSPHKINLLSAKQTQKNRSSLASKIPSASLVLGVKEVARPRLINLFLLREHNKLSIHRINCTLTTGLAQAPYLVYNRYLKQEIKIFSATEITMQSWSWLILEAN